MRYFSTDYSDPVGKLIAISEDKVRSECGFGYGWKPAKWDGLTRAQKAFITNTKGREYPLLKNESSSWVAFIATEGRPENSADVYTIGPNGGTHYIGRLRVGYFQSAAEVAAEDRVNA